MEISKSGQNEIDEIYRSLAVMCVSDRVRRVLITAEADHSAGEHALREAFSAMLLAGIPADFRIAFAAPRPIGERYKQAMRDLRLAGVEAGIFESEAEAVRWLTGPQAAERAAGDA